ncbi:MAG: hypothetical protein PUB57_03545 [Selenomonadaceae bacterium]|nr:hypothetical protein [Selenomonadaceae bacterium]
MQLLFLCTTEFQIITAFNIKMNLYSQDEADIIIDNYHGQEKEIAGRIRETKVFRHVCYVRSEIEHETLHKYFRDKTEGKAEVSFSDAVYHTVLYVTMKIRQAMQGESAYLSAIIAGFSSLSIPMYDVFLSYGSKNSTTALVPFLHAVNPNCILAEMDEGTGAYCNPHLARNKVKLDRAYLYDPELCYDKAMSCVKIPKLSKKDHKLIQHLNHVFAYDGPRNQVYQDKAIFFDQGVASAMPAYLQNMPRALRVFFVNAYRKHLEEEKLFQKEIEQTYAILGRVKHKESWIKLHPRTSEDVYRVITHDKNIAHIVPNAGVPWEIVMLNNDFSNCVFITYYSSAACMMNACMEQEDTSDNLKVICFYLRGYDMDDYVGQLVDGIACKYDNVKVPRTWPELEQLFA